MWRPDKLELGLHLDFVFGRIRPHPQRLVVAIRITGVARRGPPLCLPLPLLLLLLSTPLLLLLLLLLLALFLLSLLGARPAQAKQSPEELLHADRCAS